VEGTGLAPAPETLIARDLEVGGLAEAQEPVDPHDGRRGGEAKDLGLGMAGAGEREGEALQSPRRTRASVLGPHDEGRYRGEGPSLPGRHIAEPRPVVSRAGDRDHGISLPDPRLEELGGPERHADRAPFHLDPDGFRDRGREPGVLGTSREELDWGRSGPHGTHSTAETSS